MVTVEGQLLEVMVRVEVMVDLLDRNYDLL